MACDIDVTIAASLDSSGTRPGDSTTYTLHVVGNMSGGVRTVTATLVQDPSATMDLYSPELSGPIPLQPQDPWTPAPPQAENLQLPQQSTLDSLRQLPIDLFCNVVRDQSGILTVPSAVGSQGTSQATEAYQSGASALNTVDVATGLLLGRVVSLNGNVLREAAYEYSSSAGVLVLSRSTTTTRWTVEGMPVRFVMRFVTRNLTRS